MFDIGALELLLIGVVALLVVGPERLPKLARTAGLWLGRARRAFLSVKEEIDREIKAEELKEILRKQAQSNPLESILEDDGSLKPKSAQRPIRIHPQPPPQSASERTGPSPRQGAGAAGDRPQASEAAPPTRGRHGGGDDR